VLAIAKIAAAAPPSALPAGLALALEDCARATHHVVAGNARIALGALEVSARATAARL